jgi:integrase
MAVRAYPSAKDLAKLVKPGRYAIGHGAYLQISAFGTRSWLLRYRNGNKSSTMGLGSCSYVTLQEARDKAINAQRQRLAGLDPLTEKRKAKKPAPASTNVLTFERAALQFVSEREPSWRNGASAYQWRLSLQKYVFPQLGHMSVADITTPHILGALKPIWTSVPETARRVRNRIELILSYATAHCWRTGDNPASWQILKNLLPDMRGNGKKHLAAVPYKDLPALMAHLRQDTTAASRALQFCILCASRPSEAAGARWSEIQDGVWVIPAQRMKRNREHRVPLSSAAQALLATLPRLDAFLFPGARQSHIHRRTMNRQLKALGCAGVTHGMRAAFSTWAAEQTSYAEVVVEQALAHTVGSAVERAYRRSTLFEQRAKLLEDWAKFLGPG